VRVTRVVLPLALIAAPLVAVGARGQAERALRIGLLLAAAAVVVDAIRAAAAALPPDDSHRLAPTRHPRAADPLPAGLVELDRDIRVAGMAALPGREPRPGRILAVAEASARRRLARHGLDLDDPQDADGARALLGLASWEFVTRRRPTIDVAELLDALEAR
jgi:hypothetical protein